MATMATTATTTSTTTPRTIHIPTIQPEARAHRAARSDLPPPEWGRSGPEPGVGLYARVDLGAQRVGPVPVREHRIAQPPVRPDGRIVPRPSQLVLRVVVPVHQV